jgi:hypothetical protein
MSQFFTARDLGFQNMAPYFFSLLIASAFSQNSLAASEIFEAQPAHQTQDQTQPQKIQHQPIRLKKVCIFVLCLDTADSTEDQATHHKSEFTFGDHATVFSEFKAQFEPGNPGIKIYPIITNNLETLKIELKSLLAQDERISHFYWFGSGESFQYENYKQKIVTGMLLSLGKESLLIATHPGEVDKTLNSQSSDFFSALQGKFTPDSKVLLESGPLFSQNEDQIRLAKTLCEVLGQHSGSIYANVTDYYACPSMAKRWFYKEHHANRKAMSFVCQILIPSFAIGVNALYNKLSQEGLVADEATLSLLFAIRSNFNLCANFALGIIFYEWVKFLHSNKGLEFTIDDSKVISVANSTLQAYKVKFFNPNAIIKEKPRIESLVSQEQLNGSKLPSAEDRITFSETTIQPTMRQSQLDLPHDSSSLPGHASTRAIPSQNLLVPKQRWIRSVPKIHSPKRAHFRMLRK